MSIRETATATETAGDPATHDPAAGDPATGDPATRRPATGDPATRGPATGDPATRGPATGDPATRSTATRSPATIGHTDANRTPGDPAADVFRYVAADGPEVAPLLADLEHEYDSRYGDLLPEPAAAELARYAPERFAAPDGAFLILERHGTAIAGGAFMRYDATTAEVKRVWTSAALRGQGLAKLILKELEAEARRRGYATIYLTTGPRQPEAVRLYLGAGYTPGFDTSLPPEDVGLHSFTKQLA